ncbi:MAG: FAD-binding protein, partial [Acidimicrobiales bacterium]
MSTPDTVAMPRDESDITAAMGAAINAGSTLKVVGGAHSFTPIAATTGTLLSLDRFPGIVRVD